MLKVWKNFINLTALQLSTTFVQIIAYPYLNTTIGSYSYGEIILQQLVIFHIQMIVIFGTDLSAVRLAAKYHKVNAKIKVVVSTVILGRCYLAIPLCLIYLCYVLLSGLNYWYILFVVSIFEPVITLRWLYHGKQQLIYFTIPYCIIRILGVGLFFIFVKNPIDWYLVIPIIVFSSFLSVLISALRCVIVDGIQYIKFKYVYKLFRDAYSLFITGIVSTIKDRSGGILIGYFLGPASLVNYDFCMKIVGVVSSVTSSISAALFPSFLVNFDEVKFKKINIILLLTSLVPLLFSFFFSGYIVEIVDLIFRMNLSQIKILFPIFALMIFVRSHGYFIGLCYLMAKNEKRKYAASLIISGMVYVIMMIILLFLNATNLLSLGVLLGISLTVEYIHRVVMCFEVKKKQTVN